MSLGRDFIAGADAFSVRLEQTQFWCVVRALFGFHLRTPALGRMLGMDAADEAVALPNVNRRSLPRHERVPASGRANPMPVFAASRRESVGGETTSS